MSQAFNILPSTEPPIYPRDWFTTRPQSYRLSSSEVSLDVGTRLPFATKAREMWEGEKTSPVAAASAVAMAMVFLIYKSPMNRSAIFSGCAHCAHYHKLQMQFYTPSFSPSSQCSCSNPISSDLGRQGTHQRKSQSHLCYDDLCMAVQIARNEVTSQSCWYRKDHFRRVRPVILVVLKQHGPKSVLSRSKHHLDQNANASPVYHQRKPLLRTFFLSRKA